MPESQEREGGLMEDIRRVARAAYENFTEEEKREIENEFRSMDKNGDGKIDLKEFLVHSEKHSESFFSLLDQNNDGVLQFDELLTLSYINSSGRPFCSACKNFIPAVFFTCTQCRFATTTEANTYNLCVPCYQGRRFKHEHTDIDDNYTLLLKLQARSASRLDPPGPSPPGRRTRMKLAMKKTLRRIREVASAVVPVTVIGASLSSVIPNNTGGEGDHDYDHCNDAADASDF